MGHHDLVRDLMQTDVTTVSPQDTAAEVERTLVGRGISGAPVVQGGEVLGVISRSDLVRHLVVEQSLSEIVSDYYRDPGLPVDPHLPALDVGHLQHILVRDLMPQQLITIQEDASAASAARLLLDHHVHRALVLRGDEFVGVVTSTDLLRALAAHDPH